MGRRDDPGATAFPGIPASVALAHRFVAGAIRLYPWTTVPDEVVDRAVLIVSELATNAICHTRSSEPGHTFHATVNMDTHGVRTEVRTLASRTRGTLPHAIKPEDLLAEHGRGLSLVEQLATTWGTLAPRHHGVYAHLTWDNS